MNAVRQAPFPASFDFHVKQTGYGLVASSSLVVSCAKLADVVTSMKTAVIKIAVFVYMVFSCLNHLFRLPPLFALKS